MPPSLGSADRASVTALFKPVAQRCTADAINEMMAKYSSHAKTGIDAIQVGVDGRKINRANFPKLGVDLAHAVLVNYIKPIVTAPELQHLIPAEPCDASVDTLATLLDESHKRVEKFAPPAFHRFESLITLSDVVT